MANIPNKSDGDVLYAKNLFKIVASDSTGGNTTSSTWTQVGSTLSIPAGAVDDTIIIFLNATANLSDPSATSGSGSAQLKIGVASSETVKVTWDPFHRGAYAGVGSYASTQNASLFYQYTPTSTEKSTGFNIIVEAKGSSVGGSGVGYTTMSVVGV